jgi:hypothetical protein
MLLPPKDRLHFALQCDRQLPRINLDFGDVPLTAEFLQAVADINGPEFAAKMVRWDDQPEQEDCDDRP